MGKRTNGKGKRVSEKLAKVRWKSRNPTMSSGCVGVLKKFLI